MPKLLITGPCGFLGHHLVEYFLRNTDFDIVGLDKLTYASNGYDRLRDIKAYDDKRVRVIGCNLSQPIEPGVTREIGEFDYLIHTAAETHVDDSIIDPVRFIKSNVLGTHHLLWWVKSLAVQPKHMLLVSTDEVYGPAEFGEDVAGFDEEATFRPANPYAAAKAGGEMIAMAYANTYKVQLKNLSIINTMNLIGERQHFQKFVPLVINKVLSGEELQIHADATCTIPGQRFYLHCRTYADALGFLIKKSQAGEALPLKLHVCGEREMSNLELAELIAKTVGKPLKYKLVSWHADRPGHDLRYCMSDSKIRAMGWERPMTIDSSLQKTVRWFLENPRWLGTEKTQA